MLDNPVHLSVLLITMIAVTIYNIISLKNLMNNQEANQDRLDTIVPGQFIAIGFLIFLSITLAVLLVKAL
jgi:hypothetical protein